MDVLVRHVFTTALLVCLLVFQWFHALCAWEYVFPFQNWQKESFCFWNITVVSWQKTGHLCTSWQQLRFCFYWKHPASVIRCPSFIVEMVDSAALTVTGLSHLCTLMCLVITVWFHVSGFRKTPDSYYHDLHCPSALPDLWSCTPQSLGS